MGKKRVKNNFILDLMLLPIDEINTFEHRSVNKGVSHKCGHDGHMVIMWFSYGTAPQQTKQEP
jgi:metal-dependent amidase/aminoacylase/carboxypeptidase family protein